MSRFDRIDVLVALEAAVAANPDGRNPRDDDNTCLNRAEEPDAQTPRCIASQVHFNLTGRELEGPNSATIITGLSHTYDQRGEDSPFDRDARSVLRDAQRTFDSVSQRGGTWSAAWISWSKAWSEYESLMRERASVKA